MNIINYISVMAIPIIVLIIIGWSAVEKKKVFDNFVEGALEGLGIVKNLFPTLIGIFLAVGCLRSSGIIDMLVNLIKPLTALVNFPSEIIPLALLRPISGSAAMGVAIDIININGVDSIIGKIASTIMGATETTFYTIAIYTSCVGIKKIRFILIPALIADAVGIVVAVIICNIVS